MIKILFSKTRIFKSFPDQDVDKINIFLENKNIPFDNSEIEINTDLIGGFIVEHSGKRYDASVKNQITKLKNLLIR